MTITRSHWLPKWRQLQRWWWHIFIQWIFIDCLGILQSATNKIYCHPFWSLWSCKHTEVIFPLRKKWITWQIKIQNSKILYRVAIKERSNIWQFYEKMLKKGFCLFWFQGRECFHQVLSKVEGKSRKREIEKQSGKIGVIMD